MGKKCVIAHYSKTLSGMRINSLLKHVANTCVPEKKRGEKAFEKMQIYFKKKNNNNLGSFYLFHCTQEKSMDEVTE